MGKKEGGNAGKWDNGSNPAWRKSGREWDEEGKGEKQFRRPHRGAGHRRAEARLTFPGEFLAAGGAGEPSRAVRRFQVLLEGAFLCKVALAERTRLALDDAFVDAPEVLVEAPPLKVGGVAKRTREASVKVERGLVVVERRKGSVRFPAYLSLSLLLLLPLLL